MKVNYKKIEATQYTKISEIFGISSSALKNYPNCFGAFSENEIIGILLLIRNDEGTALIRFFHVLPLFRCHSIGTTLLKLAEEYAVSTSSKTIIAKYNDAESDIERCKRFFHKNNWIAGKYTHTKFCLRKEKFEKNYITRFFDIENTVFNKEMSFMFFNELSEEKKNQIKEQSEQMLSNGLLPFNDLVPMIKELSLFVFLNETLIGWSVVDLIKYNEVSIRNTFVINEFRRCQ
jgi:hypothetical protein